MSNGKLRRAATRPPPPPTCVVTDERATGIGARRSIDASRAVRSTVRCIAAALRDGGDGLRIRREDHEQ